MNERIYKKLCKRNFCHSISYYKRFHCAQSVFYYDIYHGLNEEGKPMNDFINIEPVCKRCAYYNKKYGCLRVSSFRKDKKRHCFVRRWKKEGVGKNK